MSHRTMERRETATRNGRISWQGPGFDTVRRVHELFAQPTVTRLAHSALRRKNAETDGQSRHRFPSKRSSRVQIRETRKMISGKLYMETYRFKRQERMMANHTSIHSGSLLVSALLFHFPSTERDFLNPNREQQHLHTTQFR